MGRLLEVAIDGDEAAVNVLIEAGADVIWSDHKGRTPLHVATRYGRAALVNALVGAGADVNKADETGSTPLYRGAEEGHTSVVRALVDTFMSPPASSSHSGKNV